MSQHELMILFQTYYEPVYRFVYFRVGHKQTAEDLVSHIFEKVIKHFPRFKQQPGATEKSWIFAIARNTLIDHYRKQANRPHSDTPIEDLAIIDTEPLPDAIVDHTLSLEQVHEAIALLPDRQKECVLLRLEADLTNTEIASVMGIDQKAVASTISKAIHKLRNHFSTTI